MQKVYTVLTQCLDKCLSQMMQELKIQFCMKWGVSSLLTDKILKQTNNIIENF